MGCITSVTEDMGGLKMALDSRWREETVGGTMVSVVEMHCVRCSVLGSSMKERLRCCRSGGAVAVRKDWRFGMRPLSLSDVRDCRQPHRCVQSAVVM